MGSAELVDQVQALVSEIDRLLFIGDAGRQRRGLRTLSVETLRYLRAAAAQVAAGERAPEALRGVAGTLEPGCAPDAPLLSLARAVEAML